MINNKKPKMAQSSTESTVMHTVDSKDKVFGDIFFHNNSSAVPGDLFHGKTVEACNILGDGRGGVSRVSLVQMMPGALKDGETVCDYIAKIARTSYAAGTKTTNDNRSLVKYLIRHKHTTPMEFVQFVFIVRAPLPIMTQMLRHRTFSFNAESARYSITKDDRYISPDERLTTQSVSNKQGSSSTPITGEKLEKWNKFMALGEEQHKLYKELVDGESPLSREVARFGLPQNMYTTACLRADLHNLSHFLKLRRDEHAQYEMRRYADAIYGILQNVIPEIMEDYDNYLFSAETFTKLELESIKQKSTVLLNCTNQREKAEYVEKLKKYKLYNLFL